MEQFVLPTTIVTTAPVPQQAYAAPFYPHATGMMLAFPEQQQQQQQPPQLQAFWASQLSEIMQLKEIKNHSLPLARIKKIMRTELDVKMIAGDVPVVFSRACEMFVLEMTMRAWNNAMRNKRRTLQKCDVAEAIAQTDIFDFLVDLIPSDDTKEDARGEPAVPCYYIPPLQDQAAAAAETAMMALMEEPVDNYAFVQRNSGLEFGSGSKSDA